MGWHWVFASPTLAIDPRSGVERRHMRQAWAPLMFAGEDQAAKLVRAPVAPATRSDAPMKKVVSLTLDGGAADAPTFEIITTPTHTQKRALFEEELQTNPTSPAH